MHGKRIDGIHGNVNSDGYSTAARERPNMFTPLVRCSSCVADIAMILPSVAWPVDTVARVCYACGRVLEYVDNLSGFDHRETVINYAPRFGGVVKRGIAKPLDNDVDRETIVGALELGYPAALIAADYKCSLRYVELIQRHLEGG